MTQNKLAKRWDKWWRVVQLSIFVTVIVFLLQIADFFQNHQKDIGIDYAQETVIALDDTLARESALPGATAPILKATATFSEVSLGWTAIPSNTTTPFIQEFDIDIDSRQEWQSTGVQIKEGDIFSVQVTDGQWTLWKDTFPYTNGSGFEYEGQSEFICTLGSQPDICYGYPIPDYPLGALIGRINEQLVGIGNSAYYIRARTSGILELSINDAHNPSHAGSGIFDNDGILTVHITVHR